MAEPFDVNLADPQGVTLTQPGTAVPDVGILPDTAPLVGPPPRLVMPPPPPPPPSPTQDPKQQLLAIIALGMAAGQGVRGGGAGALAGFADTQQHLRADQLAQYQRAVNEQKLQEAAIKTQFGQDEIDYRQREAKLQQALANFKTQALKLPDKAAYDGLADAYGNSLRAAGFRTISPDWLRQNIPYVKPSQQALALKGWSAWQANPNNKRLLDENPAQAMSSMVEIDLNGDGVRERMPLAKLAEAAGQSFAHDADGGLIAVPKEANTGTSPFDVILKTITDQFKAENRRDPNPREKTTLAQKALEMSKEKPETPPTNSYQLQPEIDPKTGQQTGRFFSFNTKTNQWSQPSGMGPDATKAPTPQSTKPLPAAQADQLSAMNMAEVEGVKVLRDLKREGLDKSNNVADPRWQKFVATRLKMESGDLNKADIQQRTAAVNAVLTRGLMGGRPAQYVAEMIQQHMPQGEMTGAKLFQIMRDVLEQTGERRTELENLTGRERGTLKPVSGETYADFLKSLDAARQSAVEKLRQRGTGQ